MGGKTADKLVGLGVKKELEARIETVLAERYERDGSLSLLVPGLCIEADASGIHLSDTRNESALASVELHELPSVRSFLVIRTTEIAIPRDVLANIAFEAARAIARQLNALESR